MKHNFLEKIVHLLLLLLIAGCTNKNETPVKSETLVRKKITLQHYFTGNFQGGFNELMDSFNKKNPDHELSITAIDHESFKTSILNELQSANPSDIYSYWAGARVESVLDKLAPIDEIWQSSSLDLKFSPAVVNSAVTYNGKKYLLPITQHFVGFFYNKKLFANARIEEPQTWEELLKVCRQLKNQKITPIALGAKNKWPAQFWFDYLLLRTAPFEYRARLTNGLAHYTDPEVIRAFQLWSELFTEGFFNKNANETDWDTGAAEAVYKGDAAMTLMGTWLISYFTDEKHLWQESRDFGFFAFPVIDKNIPLAALGPIDGLIIPLKSQNKAGAMQALAHLAQLESQKTMSSGSGAFAPSQNIPREFYSKLQQKIQLDIVKCANWAFNYDLATPPSIAELGLKSFAEFIEFPQYSVKIMQQLESQISAGRSKTAEKINKQ